MDVLQQNTGRQRTTYVATSMRVLSSHKLRRALYGIASHESLLKRKMVSCDVRNRLTSHRCDDYTFDILIDINPKWVKILRTIKFYI